MRVDWAIICRYAEVAQDGLATLVGAGIDSFWLPEFPAELAVLVAVRFVGPDSELHAEHPHELTARVLDPQMIQIAELTSPFVIERGPRHPEGWEGGAIVATLHRFRAETAGAYTIDIAVDGNHQTVPVIVNQGPLPGAPSN